MEDTETQPITDNRRTCSFCHEPKDVRITPDGTADNPIGICFSCAVSAVVTGFNYTVDYAKALARANEALKQANQRGMTLPDAPDRVQ